MAIPSVNLFANQPGGGLNYARGGINALANNRALRKYNEEKAKYASQTLMAEAASKLAYANLMGPQFLARAMRDPNFMGNMTEEQKAEIARIVNAAGTGQGTGNALGQLPVPQQQNTQPQNPIAMMFHRLGSALGFGQQQGNAVANLGQQPMPQKGGNAFNQPNPVPQSQPSQPQQGGLVDDMGNPVDEHGDSIPTPVTPKEAASLQAQNDAGNPPSNPLPMTLTTGNRGDETIPEGTYAKKGGKFEGAHKQEAELGNIRADLQKEIYHSNNALAQSGGVLDNLIDDFTKPEFIALRNQFPYFQDMQLEAASHLGSPATQHMIGKIKSEIESFKGATVMGFGGRPLVTEFHYAEKLKPTTKDTVYTATGKLQALKELHDIAVEKNNLIDQYLSEGKLTPNQALAKANKMVDTKAIKKRIEELTAPTHEIKNKKTGVSMYITLTRAKEIGLTAKQVREMESK